MATTVIFLRFPELIPPARLAERRIRLIGRRTHVWRTRRFRPTRAHCRPVVVREVIVRIVEQAIELVAGIVRLIVLRVSRRRVAQESDGKQSGGQRSPDHTSHDRSPSDRLQTTPSAKEL